MALEQAMNAQRGSRDCSILSLTSALDGGGWLAPRPCHFTRGKETRYPLYRRLGRPQDRSERVRKISPPPEFDPETVQPVASRYTAWAIPAHFYVYYNLKQMFRILIINKFYNLYVKKLDSSPRSKNRLYWTILGKGKL